MVGGGGGGVGVCAFVKSLLRGLLTVLFRTSVWFGLFIIVHLLFVCICLFVRKKAYWPSTWNELTSWLSVCVFYA